MRDDTVQGNTNSDAKQQNKMFALVQSSNPESLHHANGNNQQVFDYYLGLMLSCVHGEGFLQAMFTCRKSAFHLGTSPHPSVIRNLLATSCRYTGILATLTKAL